MPTVTDTNLHEDHAVWLDLASGQLTFAGVDVSTNRGICQALAAAGVVVETADRAGAYWYDGPDAAVVDVINAWLLANVPDSVLERHDEDTYSWDLSEPEPVVPAGDCGAVAGVPLLPQIELVPSPDGVTLHVSPELAESVGILLTMRGSAIRSVGPACSDLRTYQVTGDAVAIREALQGWLLRQEWAFSRYPVAAGGTLFVVSEDMARLAVA